MTEEQTNNEVPTIERKLEKINSKEFLLTVKNNEHRSETTKIWNKQELRDAFEAIQDQREQLNKGLKTTLAQIKEREESPYSEDDMEELQKKLAYFESWKATPTSKLLDHREYLLTEQKNMADQADEIKRMVPEVLRKVKAKQAAFS